jgi:hypothetical protein
MLFKNLNPFGRGMVVFQTSFGVDLHGDSSDLAEFVKRPQAEQIGASLFYREMG